MQHFNTVQIGNAVVSAAMRFDGERALVADLDSYTISLLAKKNISELIIGRGYWQLEDCNLSRDNHLKAVKFAREEDRELDVDLSLLHQLPKLKYLTINLRVRSGLAVIEELKELEELETGPMVELDAIDFDKLPKLHSLSLEGITGTERLFSRKTIKRLLLWLPKSKDLEFLKDLHFLEKLEICHSGSLKSLRGLPKNLTRLTLYHDPSIEDFEPIINCDGLRSLSVVANRHIHTLENFRRLSQLELLNLENCGEIDSLKPLLGLPLKKLHLGAMTKIMDGDIACLSQMESLNDLFLVNMKHYNMTLKEWARQKWPGRRWVESL